MTAAACRGGGPIPGNDEHKPTTTHTHTHTHNPITTYLPLCSTILTRTNILPHGPHLCSGTTAPSSTLRRFSLCGLRLAKKGKILASNLGEVMRCPGANPSEEDLAKHCAGKTHVDLGTFLGIMEKQTLHEDPSSLEEAFAIFDVKGLGTVDTTELRSVIGNLGERFNHEEIGQMMLMAEIDSDGRMNIADMVKFCRDYK